MSDSAASAVSSDPPSTRSYPASFNRHTVSALEELALLSPLYQKACLDLLVRIVTTVVASPADAKFRRLNSAKLRPKLRCNAAFKLLESVGFLPQTGADEEFMCMKDEPSAEALTHLTAVADALKKLIEEGATASADATSQAAAAASASAASSSSATAASALPQLSPQEGDTVEDNEFVFFWQPPAWACQWTQTPFVVDGVTYTCTEQWMMASKARLFGDHATFARILTSASPKEHKKLGRAVTPFDGAKWDAECLNIVIEGNYAKFSQHPAFAARLLATGNKLLVEASPLDRIWGIGLASSDPAARYKKQWRGKNLLGIALMKVRDRLRKEEEEKQAKEQAKKSMQKK